MTQLLRGQVETGTGSFSYWMAKLHAHYVRVSGLQLPAEEKIPPKDQSASKMVGQTFLPATHRAR